MEGSTDTILLPQCRAAGTVEAQLRLGGECVVTTAATVAALVRVVVCSPVVTPGTGHSGSGPKGEASSYFSRYTKSLSLTLKTPAGSFFTYF